MGTSLNLLEFTPTNTLVTGQAYRFRVRAINQIGTSQDSGIVSLICASPPDSP